MSLELYQAAASLSGCSLSTSASLSNQTSSFGGRLVHHPDRNTWEMETKSLPFVFGERVVRPVIKTIERSFIYRGLTSGLTSIDRVFSRAIDFGVRAETPPAKAKTVVIPSQTKEVVIYNPINRAGVVAWVGLGIDPTSFGNYVADMLPAQKLNILSDSELQRNFIRINTMMTDLSTFIVKKASNYATFRAGIHDICVNLKYIEATLSAILHDLKERGLDSAYAPVSSQQRMFELRLPAYVKDSLSKKGGFTKNGAIFPLQVGPLDMSTIGVYCTENPIEAALLENLVNTGGFLKGFNIQGNGKFTFDQFKELFSNKVIDKLEVFIKDLKEKLDVGLVSVEEIVNRMTSALQREAHKNIADKIYLVYKEQDNLLSKQQSTFVFEVLQTDQHSHLCSSWKVIHKGILWDTEIFRFELRTDLFTESRPDL